MCKLFIAGTVRLPHLLTRIGRTLRVKAARFRVWAADDGPAPPPASRASRFVDVADARSSRYHKKYLRSSDMLESARTLHADSLRTDCGEGGSPRRQTWPCIKGPILKAVGSQGPESSSQACVKPCERSAPGEINCAPLHRTDVPRTQTSKRAARFHWEDERAERVSAPALLG